MNKLIFSALIFCSSAQAQTAYTISGQSPDFSAWASFAAWSWSERAGFDIEWGGAVSPGSYIDCATSGSITVRVTAGASEAAPEFRFTSNPNTIAQALECTNGAGWVVGFNPAFPLATSYLRKSVLHEIGHGLGGAGHVNNAYAVMHATDSQAKSQYLLTTTDVEWVLANPEWSTYANPSYCHNELGPDNDIMIPEVLLPNDPYAKRALLNYAGPVGGYETWDMVYFSDSPSVKGCTNNTVNQDGTVTLTDVRGQFGNYASGTFQEWNGQWRLISYTQ